MNNRLHHRRRSLLRDLVIAAKLVMAWRRSERKNADASIPTQSIKTIPPRKPVYWPWTLEATLSFPQGTEKAVKTVFGAFDQETQRALTFAPDGSPGSWIARAKFWQQALKPHMPEKQYRAAMLTILDWYVKRFKRSKESS